MTPQTIGLIIGGLLPALLFGVGNVLIKSSLSARISIGFLLLFTTAGYLLTSLIALAIFSDHAVTLKSGGIALISGFILSIGTLCITIAINHYATPMSQLVPLYNMNTLISVLLALWLFAEWQHVRVPQLLIGSVLIVIGGTLVAKA